MKLCAFGELVHAIEAVSFALIRIKHDRGARMD